MKILFKYIQLGCFVLVLKYFIIFDQQSVNVVGENFKIVIKKNFGFIKMVEIFNKIFVILFVYIF